ncbi:MAG: type I-E CRISPR-associated protein Cse1/CasA [Proteobacteria bacterium]|nr:type I-E CRISPR-associated protein Cse1/CasA [Pseudomonadota bacterium]MBU4472097.1 type I-E CRISPR-associated protein Cse1/CasA [Pseudomonadota bacterium]MCG2752904.1 type I-E CRISPR-associated protein Cse1/CasA [Desulfobacteraceae bacterium]
MNLVTDPWLPVTDRNNSLCYISLDQLFSQPDEWLDLALRPHERVSIMRLLICIVQAALDGPENPDEWDDALIKIPKQCLTYLNEKQGHFNLYDKKSPFLQISKLKPGNEKTSGPTVTKLDSTLSVGENAATLFDHGAASALKGSSVDRQLTDSGIAISLISFLNYSPSGTQSSAKLSGKLITHNIGAMDAPCANQDMLHTFVVKSSLIETIHSNLIDKELSEDFYGKNLWGKPVWEFDEPSPLDDEEFMKNSVETYLGRLTPLSRFCKLTPNSPYFIYCTGFQYSTKPKKKTDSKRVYIDFKPEPTSTVIADSDGNYSLLKSGVNLPWREVTSLISKRQKSSYGGSLALRYLKQSDNFDIIVVGQVRDTKNVAKILDLIESRVHIPAYLMNSGSQKVYEHNIKACEFKSYSLIKAVETYRTLIDDEWKGLLKRAIERKSSEIDRKRRYIFRKNTANHYWTLIEKQRHLLLQYISLLGTEQDQEREEAKQTWLKAINAAAKETYQTLCNRDSPRQMRAYVHGWQVLYPSQYQKKEES